MMDIIYVLLYSNEQGSPTAGMNSPIFKHLKNIPQTLKISNHKTAQAVSYYVIKVLKQLRFCRLNYYF